MRQTVCGCLGRVIKCKDKNQKFKYPMFQNLKIAVHCLMDKLVGMNEPDCEC